MNRQQQTARRWRALGGFALLGLSASLLLRCAHPHDGRLSAEDVPLLGVPTVAVAEPLLLRLTGLPPEAAVTRLSFEAPVRNVPDSKWRAVLFVPVVRAQTDEIARVVASEPVELPPGASTFTETLVIDAGELPPGAYTLQPVLVASRVKAVRSFEQAIELFETDERPAAVFVAAPDESLTVLDDGEEAIRSYWTTIRSGNPTSALKGLSALIGHYRIRRQYDRAEAAVEKVVSQTRGEAELGKLHPILRYWNVDDRRLAGDLAGAIELLETLIDETPEDAQFLGEPFRGRGLLELARLHLSQQRPDLARGAYDRVLTEYPALHRPTTLMERAAVHLELGDLAAARSDYEEISRAFATCNLVVEATQTPERPPCPSATQADGAQRWLAILDSERSWFRSESEELVAAFERLVETRDVADLEAIASPISLRFAVGGGEWHYGRWEELLRPLMARLLEESEDLRLRVVEHSPTRMTLNLDGVAEEFGTGPLARVALTLDRTPFGWQWGGIDAVPLMIRQGDDDWDPCPIDIEAGETECPGRGGGTSPPGGGGPRRPASYLNVQAPWSPGTHMRAGGLRHPWDLTPQDLANLTQAAIQELALAIFPSVTSRCGAGVPGYFYGLDTHTGEDHFAIDYMKGSVLFCVWGACVAPPGAVLKELIEVAADSGDDFGPTKNAAFNKPVLAAHEGLVVNTEFSYPDGDTDKSHNNKVDIAVWERRPPPDLGEILHEISGLSSLGQILEKTEADFWLRHLHLRRSCTGQCPSRGMWVTEGQEIGRIDDTGNSFTSHLHFVVRRRPASGANVTSNWRSAPQMIDGDYLDSGDNGKCIKSKNELVLRDRDSDNIFDHLDNCVVVANPDQGDIDRDGIGDVCDPDRDNDGDLNDVDPCPNGSQQEDFDNDGAPDACDDDADGDGVPEGVDRCPFFDDAIDFDNDGIPDQCDLDADDDGFEDGRCEDSAVLACGCLKDLFPNNPLRAGDHDLDGTDSLRDTCPCDNANPGCKPLIDIPPKGGLGGGGAILFGEPFHPDVPGSDPFGPGGSPFGPGGSIP